MIKNKVSIAVVDDHKLFRSGLVTLIEGTDIASKIYEASSGQEFLNLIESCEIDVVLMDIAMPGIDGVETTRMSLKIKPDMKIISLSMYNEDEYYLRMINAGVKGFLAKDCGIEEVLKAIETVMNNENYFSSERLYEILKKSGQGIYKHDLLTERETDVLRYICQGLSNQKIAVQLNISKRTVDKHRENILSKTGCRNTASLIMFANNHKLI